ncbi:MAG: hypothetical protein IIU85_03320, partial [Rikenellaceae bacterium]|nr:hypothetical protein [Rikenellaceae bacterium]
TAATYERANLRLGTIAPDELPSNIPRTTPTAKISGKSIVCLEFLYIYHLSIPYMPTIGIPFFAGPSLWAALSARDGIIYS